MKIAEHMPKIIIILVLLGGGGAVASKFFGPPSGSTVVDVNIPQLSRKAMRGKEYFDVNCAGCHGVNGSGSGVGPPLVHDIYNPGHHADTAFSQAARQGVTSHHWSFGNMPPQPQVNDLQLASIVKYIRELQMANGIFFREHTMQ